MATFPRSKKEEADALLIQLYDSLEADTERLVITGWPARDSSGTITPQMREIRDLLLADGLIWESRRMSLGITEKGVAKVESARRSQVLRMELDAPYPTIPEELKRELEYWVQHQHDGEPGSNHWIQIQARIDHLRYLDQRNVEVQEMAKRTYGNPTPSLAPERAIKVLENQIAAVEELRTERFGSSRREEWTTTSGSVLHAAFAAGHPIFDAFSAAQAIAFNAHDNEAKLRQIANDNLDHQAAVLRSAIQQLGWDLPEVSESFHPAGSQHDAYVQIREIVQTVKSELIIVDTYVDETLWSLLRNVSPLVTLKVLTMKARPDFTLEAKHFIAQHGGTVESRITNDYHDRFLVIDKATVWHLGASIKDAGRKAFALTEFVQPSIRSAVMADVEATWNAATRLPL